MDATGLGCDAVGEEGAIRSGAAQQHGRYAEEREGRKRDSGEAAIAMQSGDRAGG